jgi:hypothetical protein
MTKREFDDNEMQDMIFIVCDDAGEQMGMEWRECYRQRCNYSQVESVIKHLRAKYLQDWMLDGYASVEIEVYPLVYSDLPPVLDK